MNTIKDIITNIQSLYETNDSIDILKDFERVLDELDLYVFKNWEDGELVEGPIDEKYFVTCTFMWQADAMPDPQGAKKLTQYNIKVRMAESFIKSVRPIKKPDDIRPGTRKGKIDIIPVVMAEIRMPKKIMENIKRGKEFSFYPKPDPEAEAIAPTESEV